MIIFSKKKNEVLNYKNCLLSMNVLILQKKNSAKVIQNK